MKIIYKISIIFGLLLALLGGIAGAETSGNSIALAVAVYVAFGVSMLFYSRNN